MCLLLGLLIIYFNISQISIEQGKLQCFLYIWLHIPLELLIVLVFNKTPYPDGQAFTASYNKAERIVKQYEWALAEWKQQVKEKPAEEKKPPERRSVVAQLHRIRDEAQEPQKRSRDRDER